MHCPGGHLLPGPKFITELLPPCPPHPELFANTCHPLSITKSPVPRWHGCPQGATTTTTTAATPLPCRPLVQKCLLLCPEPCETTRLLPSPRCSGAPQVLPTSLESARGDKKRVARSLPPCAPPCPEPGRLRFPPCGIRGSSASCRGQCRSHKVAKCSLRCPELTGGYSLPLRGVTECPPQRYSFLQERVHRCCKGYPTQEFVGCYTSEQRLSSAKGAEECSQLRVVTKGAEECSQLKRTKECPPLRAAAKGTKECPSFRVVAKGTKECPPLRAVAKGSALLEGSKGRSCSAQQLSRTRCPQHPRGTPRPSRLTAAGVKRSGHAKKSRCASKWLW